MKITILAPLIAAATITASTVVGQIPAGPPGPTITGNMLDIFGISYSPLPYVRFVPGTNFLAIGTNTYFPLPKSTPITNGQFSVQIAGPGFYEADFGTTLPRIKILAPYDTNVYTFNYCAQLAVNAAMFVGTNTFVTSTQLSNALANGVPGFSPGNFIASANGTGTGLLTLSNTGPQLQIQNGANTATVAVDSNGVFNSSAAVSAPTVNANTVNSTYSTSLSYVGNAFIGNGAGLTNLQVPAGIIQATNVVPIFTNSTLYQLTSVPNGGQIYGPTAPMTISNVLNNGTLSVAGALTGSTINGTLSGNGASITSLTAANINPPVITNTQANVVVSGISSHGTGSQSEIYGSGATATAQFATAIGPFATANGIQSVSIGLGAGNSSGAANSVAIGVNATNRFSGSVAIGPSAATTATSQVSFGPGMTVVASQFSGGGAALTSLPAGQLTGNVPITQLTNSLFNNVVGSGSITVTPSGNNLVIGGGGSGPGGSATNAIGNNGGAGTNTILRGASVFNDTVSGTMTGTLSGLNVGTATNILLSTITNQTYASNLLGAAAQATHTTNADNATTATTAANLSGTISGATQITGNIPSAQISNAIPTLIVPAVGGSITFSTNGGQLSISTVYNTNGMLLPVGMTDYVSTAMTYVYSNPVTHSYRSVDTNQNSFSSGNVTIAGQFNGNAAGLTNTATDNAIYLFTNKTFTYRGVLYSYPSSTTACMQELQQQLAQVDPTKPNSFTVKLAQNSIYPFSSQIFISNSCVIEGAGMEGSVFMYVGQTNLWSYGQVTNVWDLGGGLARHAEAVGLFNFVTNSVIGGGNQSRWGVSPTYKNFSVWAPTNFPCYLTTFQCGNATLDHFGFFGPRVFSAGESGTMSPLSPIIGPGQQMVIASFMSPFQQMTVKDCWTQDMAAGWDLFGNAYYGLENNSFYDISCNTANKTNIYYPASKLGVGYAHRFGAAIWTGSAKNENTYNCKVANYYDGGVFKIYDAKDQGFSPNGGVCTTAFDIGSAGSGEMSGAYEDFFEGFSGPPLFGFVTNGANGFFTINSADPSYNSRLADYIAANNTACVLPMTVHDSHNSLLGGFVVADAASWPNTFASINNSGIVFLGDLQNGNVGNGVFFTTNNSAPDGSLFLDGNNGKVYAHVAGAWNTLALSSGNNAFTGNNTFSKPVVVTNALVATTITSNSVTTGTITANGSGLTNAFGVLSNDMHILVPEMFGATGTADDTTVVNKCEGVTEGLIAQGLAYQSYYARPYKMTGSFLITNKCNIRGNSQEWSGAGINTAVPTFISMASKAVTVTFSNANWMTGLSIQNVYIVSSNYFNNNLITSGSVGLFINPTNTMVQNFNIQNVGAVGFDTAIITTNLNDGEFRNIYVGTSSNAFVMGVSPLGSGVWNQQLTITHLRGNPTASMFIADGTAAPSTAQIIADGWDMGGAGLTNQAIFVRSNISLTVRRPNLEASQMAVGNAMFYVDHADVRLEGGVMNLGTHPTFKVTNSGSFKFFGNPVMATDAMGCYGVFASGSDPLLSGSDDNGTSGFKCTNITGGNTFTMYGGKRAFQQGYFGDNNPSALYNQIRIGADVDRTIPELYSFNGQFNFVSLNDDWIWNGGLSPNTGTQMELSGGQLNLSGVPDGGHGKNGAGLGMTSNNPASFSPTMGQGYLVFSNGLPYIIGNSNGVTRTYKLQLQ